MIFYERWTLLISCKHCCFFKLFAFSGSRWVYGHHFLRPNETFHEPNRKFYPNEVLKSPHTEVISIDAVHGQCYVMDATAFCKGRPVGYTGEEHVYICEFRVNKKAQSFHKMSRKVSTLCTKPFAFRSFETKLKIQRNVHVSLYWFVLVLYLYFILKDSLYVTSLHYVCV